MLLLHGFLDLGRNWTFMVEALPPVDWHIAALDWRGHGQTDRVGPGGYYHFADYVRDVDVIARQIRRRRLLVVAHSMGAMVATLWLGARPAAAEGLVLVEALGPVPCRPEDYVARMGRWLDQTAPFDPHTYDKPMSSVAHAAERLERVHRALKPNDALRLAEWATRVDPQGRRRWRYDPLHRTRSPVPIPTDAAVAFWGRIQCPTVWIGGADSPWWGPQLRAWLDLRPDVPRRLLPDCGHMVQNDAPNALATELVRSVSQFPHEV